MHTQEQPEGGKGIKLLVLNLGSTSTKLGVFEDAQMLCEHTIRHDKQELSAFPGILAQQDYRKDKLLRWLDDNGHTMDSFDAIAARGGLIRPIRGGSFLVDEAVVRDAASGEYGMHPANVGMLIAWDLGQQLGIPAIFTDAPATDELSDQARVSGFAGIQRRSIFHALNAKRVARLHCQRQGLDPFKARLIVAHMGGGITVCALKGLRAIDVNSGVDGEGPFSPERAGSLPARQLLQLARDYEGGPDALFDALYRQGGLQSYFGVNHVGELIKRSEKEPDIARVLDAMRYNIAKQVGSMAVALEGWVDAILLTGGIAYNTAYMMQLSRMVDWIAPCAVYPGEDELSALAEGALRVLTGQEEVDRLE